MAGTSDKYTKLAFVLMATDNMSKVLKEAANYGDVSAKTARTVGLQTEEWQKLTYAAGYSGRNRETLRKKNPNE
jgi:hypothetical protein